MVEVFCTYNHELMHLYCLFLAFFLFFFFYCFHFFCSLLAKRQIKFPISIDTP